jgi:hypothetical protein
VRIKVGAVLLDVKKDPKVKEHNTFALFDPLNLEIRYCEETKLEALPMFLMHEVIEAIKWQCDLNLSHNGVSTLSAMVTGVLLDNPELTRLFLKDKNAKKK